MNVELKHEFTTKMLEDVEEPTDCFKLLLRPDPLGCKLWMITAKVEVILFDRATCDVRSRKLG